MTLRRVARDVLPPTAMAAVDECEATCQALLLEIAAYEFNVGKAGALVDTNVRQVAEYDNMQQSVEAEMCARERAIIYRNNIARTRTPTHTHTHTHAHAHTRARTRTRRHTHMAHR